MSFEYAYVYTLRAYSYRERSGIKHFQGIRYNKVFFKHPPYNLSHNLILSRKT